MSTSEWEAYCVWTSRWWLANIGQNGSGTTDADDRPKTPITIRKITVFVDAFEQAREANAKKAAAKAAAASEEAARRSDPDAHRKGD